MDSVQQAVWAAQSTRYAHLASGSIVIYDHLVTLGDELDLVWTGSWSLGKALFLFNRYYFLFAILFNLYGLIWGNLTDTLSVSCHWMRTLTFLIPYSCLRFFYWQGWTGWFATALAEVILQMRIYALYFVDGRKILILMITCFLVTTSTSAAIMGLALSRLHVVSRIPFTDVNFCASPNVPDWFYTFWIPILCFESLLCALAIVRGFQTFKPTGGLFTTGRHLVKVLIRDSIMYFLIMFATYLANMLIWMIGPMDLLEIPIGFTVAFSCVLGNRVILNVKRARREGEREREYASTPVVPEESSVEMVRMQSSRGRW